MPGFYECIARIVIPATGDPRCTQWIQAMPGEDVIWCVHNETTGDQTIEVTDFKLTTTNPHPKLSPLDPNCQMTVRLAVGAWGEIKCKVINDPRPGIYKYAVRVNGTVAIDPELEI